ncbi:MAG: copper amine oxidase N-terminal domain-containing protein [Clostridiales bacterium]|nr:copper amine oxidase N-terminal domain-containing protein [Clostridiales bacterium]
MRGIGKSFIIGTAVMLMSVSVYGGEVVNSNASIYVNGKEIVDASAKIYEGYTMVPIRFIAERLGCQVVWDDENKTVTINDGSTVLSFTEGVKTMIVGDEIEEIPVEPIISDDRIYVPLRAVSEGLDIDITWNEMTRTVSVYSAVAAKADYNSDYSEAPEAEITTVYLKSGEDIVVPINCDPTKAMVVDLDEDDEDICLVQEGYLDGQKAVFIHAESRGTAGIKLYYEGFESSGYAKTYINIRVVDSKEKALTNFNDMLVGKGLYYKDILNEIVDNQRTIEADNGLFVVDRSNDEYEKLYVGDKGMLVIPVDYSENASGVFDISYDFESAIDCQWGVYGGTQAIMITADNYGLVPIRISFTENASGTVTFTITDRDMKVEETPVVHSYGNNDVDTTWWDIDIRGIAESSSELESKISLTKDRVIYIK